MISTTTITPYSATQALFAGEVGYLSSRLVTKTRVQFGRSRVHWQRSTRFSDCQSSSVLVRPSTLIASRSHSPNPVAVRSAPAAFRDTGTWQTCCSEYGVLLDDADGSTLKASRIFFRVVSTSYGAVVGPSFLLLCRAPYIDPQPCRTSGSGLCSANLHVLCSRMSHWVSRC